MRATWLDSFGRSISCYKARRALRLPFKSPLDQDQDLSSEWFQRENLRRLPGSLNMEVR